MKKTILITGATSGIGRAAAEEMAARGWQVLGVGRSEESCRQAADEIRSYYPTANVAYFIADLSALRDVRRLADDVSHYLDQSCDGRLDVLVNNAGSVRNWYMSTEDGYEMQFAVNHLAGFHLGLSLLPKLANSPAAKVINISSASHKGAKINWTDIMHRKHYNCLTVYKQSKLCNVLFTHEFNRRMKDTTVRAYTVDPGLVNTNIGSKATDGLIAWFWQRRKQHGLSPYQAASAIVMLCKMPDVWQPTDSYFKNCVPGKPSKASLDEENGRRLWDLSLNLNGITIAEQGNLS
jgi:retinol dehydrogenase-12